MNNIAYIALGSNIGERYTYLTEAIKFLNKNPYIHVDDVSSVYETEPVGYTDQSCFLNLVIKISTNLSPQELLKVTQKVENGLGRKREIRWGRGPSTLTFCYIIKKILKQRILLFRIRGCSKELLLSFRC